MISSTKPETVGGVGLVTVVRIETTGKARPNFVAKRPRDEALQNHVVKITILHGRACSELAGRLSRDEINQAARCIAPPKRALRTTQNLDPFKIEHRGCAKRIIPLVNVVTVGRDR